MFYEYEDLEKTIRDVFFAIGEKNGWKVLTEEIEDDGYYKKESEVIRESKDSESNYISFVLSKRERGEKIANIMLDFCSYSQKASWYFIFGETEGKWGLDEIRVYFQNGWEEVVDVLGRFADLGMPLLPSRE